MDKYFRDFTKKNWQKTRKVVKLSRNFKGGVCRNFNFVTGFFSKKRKKGYFGVVMIEEILKKVAEAEKNAENIIIATIIIMFAALIGQKALSL